MCVGTLFYTHVLSTIYTYYIYTPSCRVFPPKQYNEAVVTLEVVTSPPPYANVKPPLAERRERPGDVQRCGSLPVPDLSGETGGGGCYQARRAGASSQGKPGVCSRLWYVCHCLCWCGVSVWDGVTRRVFRFSARSSVQWPPQTRVFARDGNKTLRGGPAMFRHTSRRRRDRCIVIIGAEFCSAS